MSKLKLDHSSCLLAECEPGKRKTDHWDTLIPGFLLETRVGGGKTFAVRYVDPHGRQRQVKICAYGELPVEKVRKEAQRLRSEIVLGNDPAAKKDVTKAIPTYAELAQRHLAEAKAYQRSYVTTAMYLNRHIIPRWGKLRLSEIKKADVSQWLATKTDEGLALATVEKIRVIFGRSFELAMQWEVPGVSRNPTRGIKRPPIDNRRERFLNPAEAARLHRAVANSANPQLQYIIGMLLLTGARLSELFQAQWQHIDLDRRTWFIPKAKTKARHVPLSTAAVDLLRQVPRFEGVPYVLPNPDTGRPYTDIKHSWDTARREAVLSGLRLHDLRHSAASFMINAGVDLFAVGKVLGHADYKSTMRYSHVANDTLMAAVEAGAKKQAVNWADA